MSWAAPTSSARCASRSVRGALAASSTPLASCQEVRIRWQSAHTATVRVAWLCRPATWWACRCSWKPQVRHGPVISDHLAVDRFEGDLAPHGVVLDRVPAGLQLPPADHDALERGQVVVVAG